MKTQVARSSNTKLSKKSSLRKKCLKMEFFWSVFSRIHTEYRDLRSKSPCSVQIRENRTRKNFVFGQFICSAFTLS